MYNKNNMKLKKLIAPILASALTFSALALSIQAMTVPSIQALFETSLQASITSNATSATLVSGTDLAGNNIFGYY